MLRPFQKNNSFLWLNYWKLWEWVFFIEIVFSKISFPFEYFLIFREGKPLWEIEKNFAMLKITLLENFFQRYCFYF